MIRRRAGLTLTEAILATLLLSVIFLGATSALVSAMALFNSLQNNRGRLDATIALEHMARKIALSNRVVVDQGGAQLKLRWDFATGTFALNGAGAGTPSDLTDDTWVKYRIIGNQLRWRNDAAESPDVGAGDPELEPGLTLQSGSIFTLVNPTGILEGSADPNVVGVPTVVEINLVAQSGTPASDVTLNTDVAAGAMTKSQ
ncbi:MAG TPA: hypothetical protein VL404_01025 [Candidatus Eisenbacteria bacterium]|nr:hypothetical protein [Candidatus Eisenbacteria bacterium]